ncbi:hypothetical protein BDR06DRAFT_955085 [Suillus hirtellus]|nr:hypothetical protein BDR06DRAFT_955085 [Suillus hirtellus]
MSTWSRELTGKVIFARFFLCFILTSPMYSLSEEALCCHQKLGLHRTVLVYLVIQTSKSANSSRVDFKFVPDAI